MSGRMFAAVALFIAAAFYLAIIMPANPPAIGGNYAPGSPSAPAAPGSNYAPGSPSAPAAPGSNYAPGSPGAPPACSANYYTAGVVISGDLAPNVSGFVPMRGVLRGKPWFSDVEDFDGLEEDGFIRLHQSDDGRWRLNRYPGGTTGPRIAWRSSAGFAATPDLAGGWEPDPASDIEPTGAPVIQWIAPPAAPAAPGSSYVPPSTRRLVITGDGMAGGIAVAGTYYETPEVIDGKPTYSSDGTWPPPSVTRFVRCFSDGGQWEVSIEAEEGLLSWGFTAVAGGEPTPDGLTMEGGDGGDGTITCALLEAFAEPPVASDDYAPGSPSAPSAPGANYAAPTPSAPAAPGSNYAPGTPSNPPAASGNYAPGTPANPPAIGSDYAPS